MAELVKLQTSAKELLTFFLLKFKVEKGEMVNEELAKLPSIHRKNRLGKYYEVILHSKMPYPKRVFNILLLRFFENPSEVLLRLRNTPYDPIYSDEAYFDSVLKGVPSSSSHGLIVRRRGKYFDYIANNINTLTKHLDANSTKDAMQGVASVLGRGSEGLVYDLHKDLVLSKDLKYRFKESRHIHLRQEIRSVVSSILEKEVDSENFSLFYDMLMRKLATIAVWKELKVDMDIYTFEEGIYIYAKHILGL